MNEFRGSWRPSSAHAVPLSDLDLAKLGLLAQLEAQCKASIAMCLKALKHLDRDEWRRLEQRQFKQLVDEVSALSAPFDAELKSLVDQVSAKYEDVLKLRHQNLHSLWGNGPKEEGLVAWDLKRDEQLSPARLDDDLRQVADFTHVCAACSRRVGQLILDGKLPEGIGAGGPNLFLGRWVKF